MESKMLFYIGAEFFTQRPKFWAILFGGKFCSVGNIVADSINMFDRIIVTCHLVVEEQVPGILPAVMWAFSTAQTAWL
jgi:hypothetical protein